MKTSVLALDLATTTGWAWHAVGMPRPFFGAFRLPAEPDEIGRPAAALEAWLLEMMATARSAGAPITHICFEAQHLPTFDPRKKKRIQMNMATVYRLIGLGAITEKVAFQETERRGGANCPPEQQCHCYDTEVSKWRKHFLGRGSGFQKTEDKKSYLPGEDPKELAIQRCAQYGWHTDIADAAEACGILDWFIAECLPRHHRPWRDEAMFKAKQI